MRFLPQPLTTCLLVSFEACPHSVTQLASASSLGPGTDQIHLSTSTWLQVKLKWTDCECLDPAAIKHLIPGMCLPKLALGVSSMLWVAGSIRCKMDERCG